MKISEVMTTDLITLNQNSSVQECAQLMKKFNIGTCLLTNGNKLAGILTDRDIVLRLIADDLSASDSKCKDFMTPSPVSVSPDTDVHEAATIMAEHQIRRLPVIQNGALVGIVTLGDLAVETDKEAERVLEQVSKPIRKEVA